MLETFKKGLHGMVKWMGESIKRIVHPSDNSDRKMLEGDILLIEEGNLKVDKYGTNPKPELTDEEKLGLLAAQCVSNYFEKAGELRRCSNKKETQINGRIDIKPLTDGSSPEATLLEQRSEFLKNENTFEIEPTIIQVVQLMDKDKELFMELFEQEMQRVDKEILEEKERKEILYYSKILEELEKAHKISISEQEFLQLSTSPVDL
ncbi:hypothetical protein GCK72_015024 [Caenorhabditis remanei]|uniref:Uncharacterized protein n=1 Tax=Caenorhabditis remanei TaxID=31234 RepID=A0A6A5GVM5_CAERE|nr:hypothetical protein GCK72_015024 [Caenorhabditis remanei]KAF1758565.1 hypothetical protein GCK72_015024 [Caenorhabditis remanei]